MAPGSWLDERGPPDLDPQSTHMQGDPSGPGGAWRLERRLLEAGGLNPVLDSLLECARSLGAGSVDAVTVALADAQHELRHLRADRISSPRGAARLRRSGTMDLLTGWHNQPYLQLRLHQEVARSELLARAQPALCESQAQRNRHR